MQSTRESIFSTSLRAFFRSIFVVLGAAIALIPALAVIGGALSDDEQILARQAAYEVLPDAEGDRSALGEDTPLIVQIDIEGVIGTEQVNAKEIATLLQESQEGVFKGERVRAILLNVNTPGGGAFESDTIYRLIERYKKRYAVPVYAYVDGLCASGGVYTTSACDKVFATPTSLIGSVGVILNPMLNVSESLERLGIQAKVLYAGKGKDRMNPTRPWEANEFDQMEKTLNKLYQRFLDVATANRPNLNRNTLETNYGAELFFADEAVEYGFIDGIVETESDVIAFIAEETAITTNGYQVVKMSTSGSWLSELMQGKTSLFQQKVVHQVQLPFTSSDIDEPFLYLFGQ